MFSRLRKQKNDPTIVDVFLDYSTYCKFRADTMKNYFDEVKEICWRGIEE